jgi:hypothetical protein
MVFLPDDCMIYGITFTDVLSELNMDEINNVLLKRGAVLSDVIFSVWKSYEDDCIWLIAADRYLSEDEIADTISFIGENEFYYEYSLGGTDFNIF